TFGSARHRSARRFATRLHAVRCRSHSCGYQSEDSAVARLSESNGKRVKLAPMPTPLQPFPVAPRLVRAEHVVMAGAALALVVLVALPLAFLIGGSLTGDDGPTLAH